MNEELFEKVENYYLDNSVSYERCGAFRMALSSLRKLDYEKYKEVIIKGFEESFDYDYLDEEDEEYIPHGICNNG